ncbi:MAG: chromate transporter, partial [Eubacteriales bacterium]|nr:chromate transporter [Eubacteriales bacterium]
MQTLWQLYSTFFRIGILTFGGGYAMLPMITREIVEKHGWATEENIMDYYVIAQCTPGITAVNTA